MENSGYEEHIISEYEYENKTLRAELAALKEAMRPVVAKGICDQSGQHVTVFCNVDEWAAVAALVGEG